MAAKRLLAKALTLDKSNGSGWLIAANIEQRLGNDGLVGLILRRGIECAPSHAELYRALGEHLVRKGDFANVSDITQTENDDTTLYCYLIPHFFISETPPQAREIFEKGIEINPLHAPTYHSLAELEARVFNVEGLAKLNRRAMAVFSTNAMQPTPSTQAWGTRLFNAQHSSEIPKRVAILAQKIVEDEAGSPSPSDDLDPFAALERMSATLVEDELVGDLLQTNHSSTIF